MVEEIDKIVKGFFDSDETFYPLFRRTLAIIKEGKTYPSPYNELMWCQFALRLAHESNPTMKDLLQQVLDGLDSQK